MIDQTESPAEPKSEPYRSEPYRSKPYRSERYESWSGQTGTT
ncbi:hypothetical protein ACSCB1_42690 [Streptomyces europaeiscabiei]|uniref:Uncharacterized protein n=1 Tax=Streptomyces europaeiscabiei TaxID=146819 RepID=A0ABU4NIE3_9ACTN|nr:hypothetical protein [Streptomyces europaeiscabiei]MDX2764814.1 hypothetical protein [Streptomyces europaeiscabiei]MDX3544847.1 hypothetical protein [Streptomyces europaeiscabiei]MDX3554535.1 hypothetical protein [Streptomyces europaeiscabiei]MDX3670542.1 hypothetical protein [Streptomyces europaeiscabiei]MDX3702563.1 hypothetical protein [Streptomyces europaeiscabiei]